MNLSFEGIYDWVREQGKWILLTAVIVILLITAFRRQWMAMVGSLIGLSFIGIFIYNPDIIEDLGTFLSDNTGLNN